jgi:hypothetical protein
VIKRPARQAELTTTAAIATTTGNRAMCEFCPSRGRPCKA